MGSVLGLWEEGVGQGLSSIQAWPLVVSLPFFGFGFGFGLGGAGWMVSWHWALDGAFLSVPWSRAPITLSPVLKLVLAVGSKVLPVAGHPAPEALSLGRVGTLVETRTSSPCS